MKRCMIFSIFAASSLAFVVILFITNNEKVVNWAAAHTEVEAPSIISFKEVEYQVSICELDRCSSAKDGLSRYLKIIKDKEQCFIFGPNSCFIRHDSPISPPSQFLGSRMSELRYEPSFGMLDKIVMFAVITRDGPFVSYHVQLPGYSAFEQFYGLVHGRPKMVFEVKRVDSSYVELSNDDRLALNFTYREKYTLECCLGIFAVSAFQRLVGSFIFFLPILSMVIEERLFELRTQ